MNAPHHRSERGQIIILFVFGLVGLLGFTALAIDGGMVYSDRRFDQSVADAAALAGAGAAAQEISSVSSGDFGCSNPVVIAGINAAKAAAIERGADNGFANETALLPDLSTHHGVTVVCNDVAPKYLEVQVELSSVTHTSLIHIITGQDEIPVNAKSKVRIYGRSPLVPGAAIVGLSPYCQGSAGQPYGIEYDGTGETVIVGGGIFSNGGVYSGGSNYIKADSMRTVADVPVRCPDGFRGNNDNLDIPADAILNGIEDGVEPITIDIDQEDCSSFPPSVLDTSTSPPTWSAGTHSAQLTGSIHLAPGMHCLMNGLKVTGNGDQIIGDEVTIYVQGGDFVIGGQGTNTVSAELHAWTLDSEGTPEGIPGMLIYVDPDNVGALVKIVGSSTSTFEGTIYNPSGTVDLGGDASIPEGGVEDLFEIQVIAWNIKVHGGPGLAMLYEENSFYQFSAYLDQYE